MTQKYSRFCCSVILITCAVVITDSTMHTCWVPPPTDLKFASLLTSMSSSDRVGENMRITATYTNDFTKLANSEEFKEKVVTPALDFWSKALKVKHPPGGPLKIARDCKGGLKVALKQTNGASKDYCYQGCATVTSCYGTPVPSEFLDKCEAYVHGKQVVLDEGGPGAPDSDYLLIVDSRQYPQCNAGTLAFASVCQLDSTSNRPILGYINFCPQKIYLTYPKSVVARVTALHELAHAFGFTPTMYAYMRDEKGNPRTPRKEGTGEPALGKYSNGIYIPSPNTLSQVNRRWVSVRGTTDQTRVLLKTPNVLRVARKHFGCDELDGIEMENQGGAGTVGAHFEKRIVLNEAMSGSVGSDARLSNLTLAFFEDSGWYTVDWSKAENYQWASNAGCDFLYNSCFEYIQKRTSEGKSAWPWCVDLKSEERRCLTYANAYGKCNLKKLDKPLPEINQYLSDVPGQPNSLVQYYGGADILTDYCPYRVAFLGNADSPSSYCSHTENQFYQDKVINRQGQTYGTGSRCFDHDNSVQWKSYQCNNLYEYQAEEATCHRFQCSPDQGLMVLMGEKEFVCPVQGGPVQIDSTGPVAFVTGRLICPECSSVCQNCPKSDVLPRTEVDERPENLPCP
ncbi:Leishmanolysin peptidase [Fasciola hepatica]|uniref:Leishmanolysin-like peptidase n=1 Tax=Fasciola hepatica TaxID=6192 RepID=A0A4E0R6K7_FASHE|nr:Leishmanolysin peptidase [Fasciola hepatica]